MDAMLKNMADDGLIYDTEAIRAAVRAAFERRRIPQHPQYGYWTAAGYVKAAKPALDEPQGWLCSESGAPGKWQAIRYVEAGEKPTESATETTRVSRSKEP
jgi:hypothetical protein